MAAGNGVTGDDAFEGGFVGHAGPNEKTHGIIRVAGGVNNFDLGGDVFKTDDFPIGEPIRPNTIGGIPGPHGGSGELPKPVGPIGVIVVAVGEQNKSDL